jgi:hypothetical protein
MDDIEMKITAVVGIDTGVTVVSCDHKELFLRDQKTFGYHLINDPLTEAVGEEPGIYFIKCTRFEFPDLVDYDNFKIIDKYEVFDSAK